MEQRLTLKRHSKMRRDLRLMKGIATGRGFQCLVQVTNRCNMQCGFCDFWRNPVRPADEVDLASYRDFAEALARDSSYVISIEGGEPLLRRDIVDIVAAFSAKHHTLLYTNGSLMTAEMARALFGAGLNHAGVSIDFPDARHPTARCFAGALDKARGAIDLLRAAAPKGGRQVHVMTVLMRENEDCLEDLLRLSASHGVGHMVTLLSDAGFRRGRGGGYGLPSPAMPERLMALSREYPHLLTHRGYIRGMGRYLGQEPMPACLAGTRSLNVDHVGGVSVCIEKIDRPVGNIREHRLPDLLANLRNFDLEGCQDCWTLCRGFNQVYGKISKDTLGELLRLR